MKSGAGFITAVVVSSGRTSNAKTPLMLGVYETMDGKHVMVTTPLTETEIAAWKAHPDTFFGEVRQLPKTAKNWLELAQFFYDTYKDTDREKLLEWMKDAADVEYLKALSQKNWQLFIANVWDGAQKQKNRLRRRALSSGRISP